MEQHIEVVDPTHPLYGLTLPCLGITTKQLLGRVCIVWLAPGIERLIPVTSTNLVPPLAPPSPCRLSAHAVQRMLSVLLSALTEASDPSAQEDHDGASAQFTHAHSIAVAALQRSADAAGSRSRGEYLPVPGVDNPDAAPTPAVLPAPHGSTSGGVPCR